MILADATIYNEGVSMHHEAAEKIQKMVKVIHTISPSSNVSLRLLKSGHAYEGLLWSQVDNVPIGVYKRGTSLSQMLDSLFIRAKSDCLKAKRRCGGQSVSTNSESDNGVIFLAKAG